MGCRGQSRTMLCTAGLECTALTAQHAADVAEASADLTQSASLPQQLLTMLLHQKSLNCIHADTLLLPHLSQLRVIHNSPVAAEILLERLENLFVVNALLQALQVARAVSTSALLKGCNRTLPACYTAWRQTLQTFQAGTQLCSCISALPATGLVQHPCLCSICSFPLHMTPSLTLHLHGRQTLLAVALLDADVHIILAVASPAVLVPLGVCKRICRKGDASARRHPCPGDGTATELLSAPWQHCWQQNALLGGLAHPAGPLAAASHRQHPSGLTKTAKVGGGSACWRSNVSHKQLKWEGAVVTGKGCAAQRS